MGKTEKMRRKKERNVFQTQAVLRIRTDVLRFSGEDSQFYTTSIKHDGVTSSMNQFDPDEELTCELAFTQDRNRIKALM